MDSPRLTPKQREQLKAIIWKHTRFLNRLIDRILYAAPVTIRATPNTASPIVIQAHLELIH